MTLTITATPTTGYPTNLVVTSDKRKHAAVPAVTETATITVAASGETKVYSATREVTPAQAAYVDPVSINDTSGVTWRLLTDDGVTATYTTP